jgi:hypothetical protein
MPVFEVTVRIRPVAAASEGASSISSSTATQIVGNNNSSAKVDSHSSSGGGVENAPTGEGGNEWTTFVSTSLYDAEALTDTKTETDSLPLNKVNGRRNTTNNSSRRHPTSASTSTSTSTSVPTSDATGTTATSYQNKAVFPVPPETDCTLEISVKLLRGAADAAVYTPNFSKPKTASYWLILGTAADELLTLKKIGTPRNNNNSITSTSINFLTPQSEGRELMRVYLVSDSVMGLDVTVDVPIVLKRT